MSPKYSVIIPAYNREAYIAQALDSVLSQSFDAYEVIVCDDGSTDRTASIVERYGDKVTLLHTSRRGPGGARNAAVKVASGTYLSFLDSDDVWAPWTLRMIDDALVKTGAAMVWLTAHEGRTFADWGGPSEPRWRTGNTPFCLGNELAAASGWGALERDVFERMGGFSEELTVGEDVDLLFRLCTFGPVTHITAPALFWYRIHAEQSVPTADGAALRRCGELLFSRWERGLYHRAVVPKDVNRRILMAAHAWQAATLEGSGVRERWTYLRCCYFAARYGAVSRRALPRLIARACFGS